MIFKNIDRLTLFTMRALLLFSCAVTPCYYASDRAMVLAGVGVPVVAAGAAAGYCKATYNDKMATMIGSLALTSVATALHKKWISGVEAVGIGLVMAALTLDMYKRFGDCITIKRKGRHYTFNACFKGNELSIRDFCTNGQPKVADVSYDTQETIEGFSYSLNDEQQNLLLSHNGRVSLMRIISEAAVQSIEAKNVHAGVKKFPATVRFSIDQQKPLKAGAGAQYVQDILNDFLKTCKNDKNMWGFFSFCCTKEDAEAQDFREACRETLQKGDFNRYSALGELLQACHSTDAFKATYKKFSLSEAVPGVETLSLLRALLLEMHKKYNTTIAIPPLCDYYKQKEV